MASSTALKAGTMAKQKPMGKVPSLGGKPAMQAMGNAVGGPSRPMRTPGKPANLFGVPPGKASTQTAKKPKGKAIPTLKKGNIPGVKRKSVADLKKTRM